MKIVILTYTAPYKGNIREKYDHKRKSFTKALFNDRLRQPYTILLHRILPRLPNGMTTYSLGRWCRSPYTTGTDRKAQKNWPFTAGKPRKSMENESSIPSRKIVELYQWLSAISYRTEKEFGWKIQEKSEVSPARNTASMKSPEFSATNRFSVVLSDLGILF